MQLPAVPRIPRQDRAPVLRPGWPPLTSTNFITTLKTWSVWQDSNLRLLASRASTLTRLSYTQKNLTILAEVVGFEPTDPFESPVFKAGAIDHSTKLPKTKNIDDAESNCCPSQLPLGPRALSLELYIELVCHATKHDDLIGAQGGTRTHKNWFLRPARIPIPAHALKRILFCFEAEQTCMVRPVGLEPTASSF